MKIRKAKKKDSVRILELLGSDSNLHGCESDKPLPKDVKQCISGGTHWTYVYEIENKIVGVIAAEAYKIAKYIYISYIVVDKNYQKKGIGIKLLKIIEEKAKKKKYYLVELVTKKTNSGMKKLAKKINYSFGGDYLFYYKDIL